MELLLQGKETGIVPLKLHISVLSLTMDPEALRGGGDITWSRHITAHDRIIYDIYEEVVEVYPERKAPQSTREYAAHRLDTVLDKFLKTMQTTATRLQEKLLKPEARQKGKEQVKEKAQDSVLQLLNRLQAEQAQNKPAAQPRTQEGHSEI